MKHVLFVAILLSLSFTYAGTDNPLQFNANDIEADVFGIDLRKKLNRRVKYPAGLNVYIAGPVGFVGCSFDYFVTPKIALEIGGGVRTFEPDHGFFFGGRYHLFGKTPLNLTPYVGVYSGFEYTGHDLRNYNLYIPVGIQRIKRNKVAWSIEIAYQRNSYNTGSNLYGGGKLGFRF